MRSRKKDADQDVVRITDAPVNLSEDVAERQRRYLLSMAVRTVCFVGAVVSYTNGLHWLAWLLIIASFALPFVAVVVANAASPRLPEDVDGPGFDPDQHYKELE
ncbi:DUF3099 domain-containing protein [Nocardioides marmorisolisilvae]|uniref:DUF3099 domain-containing protein n=1 Tax=Nocardioides marmorisolisilvae TaxID=1542737 RepID=A0A3N0DV25_9ACTN|nr:DUF3099 domain-containing protein [Nocardioides marmorisolisilvae]RNL79401.1 DUF3099 domain-containing protein [Nocardioides marmorisolisilvae]